MRIEKEKPKNPNSAIRNPNFNGPMVSACNALAPGPRPRHSGNVKPPQPGVYLMAIMMLGKYNF
jgi:hypothetical protein